MVETGARSKPLAIALQEIAEGKVNGSGSSRRATE